MAKLKGKPRSAAIDRERGPAPAGAPNRRREERWAIEDDGSRPVFELRQQAILDTGERLFVENGYENTSLADIAEVLKVTKPAIYHYFQSKEQILRVAFERAELKVGTLLEHALESGHTGAEKLRQFAEGYAEHMTTLPGKCLIRTNLRAVSKEFESWAVARVVYTDSIVRRIIAEGMRDGSIRQGDVKMATFALFGALHWIAFWYREGRGLDPKTVARQIVGWVIDGMSASPLPMHADESVPAGKRTQQGT